MLKSQNFCEFVPVIDRQIHQFAVLQHLQSEILWFDFAYSSDRYPVGKDGGFYGLGAFGRDDDQKCSRRKEAKRVDVEVSAELSRFAVNRDVFE